MSTSFVTFLQQKKKKTSKKCEDSQSLLAHCCLYDVCNAWILINCFDFDIMNDHLNVWPANVCAAQINIQHKIDVTLWNVCKSKATSCKNWGFINGLAFLLSMLSRLKDEDILYHWLSSVRLSCIIFLGQKKNLRKFANKRYDWSGVVEWNHVVFHFENEQKVNYKWEVINEKILCSKDLSQIVMEPCGKNQWNLCLVIHTIYES